MYQVSVGPLAESGLSDVYPGRVPRKLWLTGDPLDLAYLAATLPIGDTQVIKDGDRYCMTSVEADTVADAQVPEVARKLVVRINGIGRLQKASFRPVEFADVYEDDAGVTVVGATATLRAGSSMVAEAVVLDADGNVVRSLRLLAHTVSPLRQPTATWQRCCRFLASRSRRILQSSIKSRLS